MYYVLISWLSLVFLSLSWHRPYMPCLFFLPSFYQCLHRIDCCTFNEKWLLLRSLTFHMLDFQRIVNAFAGWVCICAWIQWHNGRFCSRIITSEMECGSSVECLNPALKRYVSFVSHQRFFYTETVMVFYSIFSRFFHIQSFFSIFSRFFFSMIECDLLIRGNEFNIVRIPIVM